MGPSCHQAQVGPTQTPTAEARVPKLSLALSPPEEPAFLPRLHTRDYVSSSQAPTRPCSAERQSILPFRGLILKGQLDVNFWGAVQSTFAALPHLKRTRGRIVVTASATGWNPVPRMIFYNAANAALINFFETLRTELGSQVGITIVTPGWIESEMSKGKFLKEHGGVEVDQEFRDAQVGLFPVEYAKNCARAMVQAARQGDRYLTVPSWFGTMYLWRVFAPEVVEFCYRLLYMHGHGGGDQTDAPSKTMAQGGGKQMLYPSSLHSSDVKNE